ncbi:heat shock protein 70 putative [Entamoeba histolytica]|uniref:Heat shock protein 70, putative n=4 Tax=Entamoeba histolytica TaxID=5759 RepID=C4LT65_ENTH1|nr:heat shock protein 70, putative [Entamoeba histolytica HM-1:IMSS]EAL46830.2 heat shock protein 70, putative [Entamoeba histolytica HM-1:IMSS]EMD46135.1 heat shock protein, putative [Entamoeba histolytica KU27]GAT91739.1 heat shock protein 70 putative [Entamoeba histolytica]|eukprot:XP_652216.2 heat shock protein 70, putative [Entamoeba histolytica HM-1:IMSS]
MTHNIKLILVFFSLLAVSFAAIVGMDVGTQFTKTAFIGPKKVDIVENEESKRKDPTLVGLDLSGRRVFGTKAQKLAFSSPKRIFMYSNKLIGKSFNDPFLEYLQSFIPSEIVPQNNTRMSSPPVYQVGNITLSAEEVTAMMIQRQLKHVKTQYQTTVTDGVLTVSPSSTPIERYALVHAAKLAKLQPIALVNSPMAFASSLAVNRDLFEVPTNVLFIDIGATSVDIGVFNFSSESNTTGAIKALGYYTSPYFGGHNFDKVIADIVFKRVQNQVNVSDEKGGLYRQILQQSEKAKIVLSVNKETSVKVILPGGIDWSTPITLKEFEEASEEVRKRLDNILEEAIEFIGIKKEDINMVQLLGGGMRVPMVLKTITEYFGEEKINRNVDAQEGGAFGAAYYALMQGLGRMKKQYKIKDFVPIDWYINSPYLDKEFKLFSHKWKVDSMRTVSFNKVNNTKEFNFTISYSMMGSKDKVAYMVGIGNQFNLNQTLNERGIDISLTFKLNSYGLVDISKSEMKYTAWTNCTEKKYKVINVTEEVNETENNSTENIPKTEKESIKEEIEIEEEIIENGKEQINEENIEIKEEEINNNETENHNETKKTKITPKVEWEEHIFECAKNETSRFNFFILYHPLISFMSRNYQRSKEILKWFDDIDESFKQIGEMINNFESTLYALKKEVIENESLEKEKKEEFLKKINEQQEFLEFNTIDDIELDEFTKRAEVIKSITEFLHPELYEKVKDKQLNETVINMTEENLVTNSENGTEPKTEL